MRLLDPGGQTKDFDMFDPAMAGKSTRERSPSRFRPNVEIDNYHYCTFPLKSLFFCASVRNRTELVVASRRSK